MDEASSKIGERIFGAEVKGIVGGDRNRIKGDGGRGGDGKKGNSKKLLRM